MKILDTLDALAKAATPRPWDSWFSVNYHGNRRFVMAACNANSALVAVARAAEKATQGDRLVPHSVFVELQEALTKLAALGEP